MNSKEEKCFRITIDRKLSLDQILRIHVKIGQSLSALSRISPYLEETQTEVIYSTMIKSQIIRYCLLIWMFCSRESSE